MMNLPQLVWSYLKEKPVNTVLNIFLLSLGMAVITVLLIFRKQLEEKISENARGIDLVVGAKGSPLQLILCNIFHIDFPTGNIKLYEAEKLARHRLVKEAVPLALGDSYKGFRIVGTNKTFVDLYALEVSEGKWWEKNLDVTLGANVASTLELKVGDTFMSSHGLAEEGHAHDEASFVVTGIMKPTNAVSDNLILTNVQSIWAVHEISAHESNHADEDSLHDHSLKSKKMIQGVAAGDSSLEITAMLIKYRSPMAAIQLPRIVNGQSSLQAASPAFETARLFSIIGVGAEILSAFAYVLIAISLISIFIALYNSLRERKYDLAVLRTLGASRSKIFAIVLTESITLTILGTIFGLLIGHGIIWVLSSAMAEAQQTGVTGAVFYPEEWIILGTSIVLGVVCGIIPAIQAYRTDISKVLAGN